MRILFVSPYPPTRDGIGTYTRTLMTALKAGGHETRVVVPRPLEGPSSDVLGHLGSGGPDLATLGDVVRSWSPDLIHLQFGVGAFGSRTRALLSWLRLIRAADHPPVVATMHEVTRDTALLRGPGRALYRKLAAQCDHVIVHTRSARASITGQVGMPEAKVTVISHPEAQPPRVVSSAADLRAHFGLGDAELLLAFGFVHVDKGLDDLIRALRVIRRSGAPSLDRVRLVIAGTVRPRSGLFRAFELRDRLHLARVLRMARRAGLEDTIVRTGYVPDADVAGWFQAAAAAVLPYRRIEQSGVAGLANAFGVPVLASTAGGLGEQYGGSPWTFAPASPGELATVLARFLAAPPDERARARGRTPAADMDSVVTATLGVYDVTARPTEAVPAGAAEPAGAVAVAGSRPDAP
jgi:glycosyltransferase involved in cell wall biosynthesis